mmetsp:Transcript_28/g.38  ORF Transcript_28/g.38 Transcript_28/m.38 type:complete len:244 (+) Transcript_28:500-1231(+)
MIVFILRYYGQEISSFLHSRRRGRRRRRRFFPSSPRRSRRLRRRSDAVGVDAGTGFVRGSVLLLDEVAAPFLAAVEVVSGETPSLLWPSSSCHPRLLRGSDRVWAFPARSRTNAIVVGVIAVDVSPGTTASLRLVLADATSPLRPRRSPPLPSPSLGRHPSGRGTFRRLVRRRAAGRRPRILRRRRSNDRERSHNVPQPFHIVLLAAEFAPPPFSRRREYHHLQHRRSAAFGRSSSLLACSFS